MSRPLTTGRCVIDDGIGLRIWHLEVVGSRRALCGMRIVAPRVREFADAYPPSERPCLRCAGTAEWRRELMVAIAARDGAR